MAVQMTRAEYEEKYGSSPVLSASTIDITPAPIKMTRAEYNEKYKPQTPTFGQDFKQDIEETKQAQQSAVNKGVEVAGNIKKRVQSGETSKIKGAFQRFGTGLGTAANVLFQTGVGAAKAVLPQKVEDRISETLGEDLNKIFAPETRQQFIEKLKTSDGGVLTSGDLDKQAGDFLEEVGTLYKNDENFRTTVQAAGGITEWLALPSTTRAVVKPVADTVKRVDVAPLVKKITQPSDVKIETKRVADLEALENKYSQFRKLNEFSDDGGAASRSRIARSNVLEGVADEDGVIRTKGVGGAVDQYRKATIEGVEDVVKRNLEREGKSVSIPELKNFLTLAVSKSGLEGGDLVTAMKGIEKELKGLSIRMDELGQISLDKIQDAKVNTTKNINFNTPPETATYRKTIARAYKEIIEKKSDFNVKEVNAELAKFYKDIERLEMLDGKRVKGGRLGKYFAQISGNIIGGAAGSAVGGPIGTALGTIAGGEAASFISGKAMSRALGKGGVLPEKNPILEQARKEAGLPAGRSLDVPDPVIGIPKQTKELIEKNATPKQKKELLSIQKQMADNIKQQKSAIKAKDYTLVDSLKKVYEALIVSLKELVAEIIESVKNPTIGLSIKSTVTPQNTAKMMDFEDFQDILTFLDDPQASLLNDKLLRLVDEIGIGNADLETQTKFLQEVTDEADRLGLLQSNNLGKRNTQYNATSDIKRKDINSKINQNEDGVK